MENKIGSINWAIENYINGNISVFKRWLKGRRKKQIPDIMEAMRGQYGMEPHVIAEIFRKCL